MKNKQVKIDDIQFKMDHSHYVRFGMDEVFGIGTTYQEALDDLLDRYDLDIDDSVLCSSDNHILGFRVTATRSSVEGEWDIDSEAIEIRIDCLRAHADVESDRDELQVTIELACGHDIPKNLDPVIKDYIKDLLMDNEFFAYAVVDLG